MEPPGMLEITAHLAEEAEIIWLTQDVYQGVGFFTWQCRAAKFDNPEGDIGQIKSDKVLAFYEWNHRNFCSYSFSVWILVFSFKRTNILYLIYLDSHINLNMVHIYDLYFINTLLYNKFALISSGRCKCPYSSSL